MSARLAHERCIWEKTEDGTTWRAFITEDGPRRVLDFRVYNEDGSMRAECVSRAFSTPDEFRSCLEGVLREWRAIVAH